VDVRHLRADLREGYAVGYQAAMKYVASAIGDMIRDFAEEKKAPLSLD
jgi:hypothetical protein